MQSLRASVKAPEGRVHAGHQASSRQQICSASYLYRWESAGGMQTRTARSALHFVSRISASTGGYTRTPRQLSLMLPSSVSA